LQLPEYDYLAEVIARANLPSLPAELHGLAAGLLIADRSTPASRYLKLILDEPEKGDVLAAETQTQFETLFVATREILQTPTLEFELLLPDDNESVETRVDAACEWARGCLYGLMEQGLELDADLSEDVSGFLQDLLQLSSGGYDVSEDEEAEMIYADLQEYLRMGVLMTQEELQPIKAPPQQPLH